MSQKLAFGAVGVLAIAAGAALWFALRPAPGGGEAPRIAPVALYAATFTGADGRPQALGQFQGRLLVLNFWATWCAPCREEMPGFERVHARWKGRGVDFVGISAEEPAKVARFAADLGVTYALWTGGDEVGELSKRLGNRLGVLPHTALIGPAGEILETRVGPYTESQLQERLETFSAKRR